jgi:hypothetical protein
MLPGEFTAKMPPLIVLVPDRENVPLEFTVPEDINTVPAPVTLEAELNV